MRMLRSKWTLALGSLIVLGALAGPSLADEGRRGGGDRRSYGGGEHRSYGGGDYRGHGGGGGYHRPPPPAYVYPRPVYGYPYGGCYVRPTYPVYYGNPSCGVSYGGGYIYSTADTAA